MTHTAGAETIDDHRDQSSDSSDAKKLQLLQLRPLNQGAHRPLATATAPSLVLAEAGFLAVSSGPLPVPFKVWRLWWSRPQAPWPRIGRFKKQTCGESWWDIWIYVQIHLATVYPCFSALHQSSHCVKPQEPSVWPRLWSLPVTACCLGILLDFVCCCVNGSAIEAKTKHPKEVVQDDQLLSFSGLLLPHRGPPSRLQSWLFCYFWGMILINSYQFPLPQS